MRKNGLTPALIGSALLHVAVFGFALWKWPTQTREVLNAVPVQIVSDMPALAPAPSAEPEMNETPDPVVEEPALEPTPEPTPPKPEPKPVPPKPEPKKPEPKKPEPKPWPAPAKADKTPAKKPKKEEADTNPLDFVKDLSRSSSKPKSAANPAKGTSRSGPATQDLGPAINALSDRLNRLWNPNCGVEGAEDLVITVGFSISETGRVIRGPMLKNRGDGPVWQAASTRALSAVKRGEPYVDLPDQFYREPIEVTFDGAKACN